MIRILFISVCVLGSTQLFSQNSLDSLLRNISAQLAINTIDPDPYQVLLFSERNDTLIIYRTVTKQVNKDTTLNIIYELPISNIKSVSTRTFCGGPGSRYYIDFFSMDRRRSFKEHLLSQNKSFDEERIMVGTAQLKDSIYYKEICSVIKAYLTEYTPDCTLLDTTYWEYFQKDMQVGHFDRNLMDKAKVNGQVDKEETISNLLINLLKDKSKESRFAGFELRLLINKTDQLTKMATSYTVFTSEEFEQVFKLLKTQNWETGVCDNSKVDTLLSISMKLN